MRNPVSVKTDELEDELELHDEVLRKQIADGYQAYLHGETKDLDKLTAELRHDLTAQKNGRAIDVPANTH